MNRKTYLKLLGIFITWIFIAGFFLCVLIIIHSPRSAETADQVTAKIQGITDIEKARAVLMSDDTYIGILQRIIAQYHRIAVFIMAVAIVFGLSGIVILLKARTKPEERAYPSDGANAALDAPRSSS